MVTQDGQPVECFLTPGGFGDVEALKYYADELPDGSIIYADKAYNDYSSPYTFFLLNGDMELYRNRHLFIQKIF